MRFIELLLLIDFGVMSAISLTSRYGSTKNDTLIENGILACIAVAALFKIANRKTILGITSIRTLFTWYHLGIFSVCIMLCSPYFVINTISFYVYLWCIYKLGDRLFTLENVNGIGRIR
jgi:hypothetical protein